MKYVAARCRKRRVVVLIIGRTKEGNFLNQARIRQANKKETKQRGWWRGQYVTRNVSMPSSTRLWKVQRSKYSLSRIAVGVSARALPYE